MSIATPINKQQASPEELEKLYAQHFTPNQNAVTPATPCAHFKQVSLYDYTIRTVVQDSSSA